jgi:hypothetical protein
MVNGVQPNFALTEHHETMVKVFMSLQWNAFHFGVIGKHLL